ncbi:sugar isomerase domain-containing protein [Leifsonia sp. AG29]|uniref:sugar isomerase domain-containing protein n=1 Tax=Leifsonia sp. AG29 TaxID=2598860 RepID=UPI00131E2305|nr:SIS domain-containing protein [Leifsonia sp. AG29]
MGSFYEATMATIPEVFRRNGEGIRAAAAQLSTVIRDGGIVHSFGSGHSQAGALELAGRAGGLIPTNRLSITDLVLLGRHPASLLDDPLLERRADIGRELYDVSDVRAGDALVVMSNSGINGSVVELSLAAAEAGVPVIAITSLAHSSAGTSRHSSGLKLMDVAQVVLDNGAPEGDAILPLQPGVAVNAVSSITTAFLVQCVVAETIRALVAYGLEPPVYVSANLPGGHDRNIAIEERYEGRLRRLGA